MKTIVLDFDGVLHWYRNGWKGSDVVADIPVPGAIDFVKQLVTDGLKVVIVSSRAETQAGKMAIQDWLDLYGFEGISEITATKVPASYYIDDRGIQFNGDFGKTLQDVRSYVQWTQK